MSMQDEEQPRVDPDKMEDGSEVDLEEFEPADVEDTEDGGAMIYLDDRSNDDRDPDHFENLLPLLDPHYVNTLQQELYELIKLDKQSRDDRDKQYADALKRTGMGEDAPGGAEFAGASKVTHPMLTEACIDFGSRAYKELIPAEGPVKDHIIGKVTTDKWKRSQRKVRYMNWQLMFNIVEFVSEMDKLLTQVPLGGGQYSRWRYDHRLRRPAFTFVPIDNVYVPWAASSFESAERRTCMIEYTRDAYERAVASGSFIGTLVTAPAYTPEQSEAAQATDKIQGREESTRNEDEIRPIWETELLYSIPKDAWLDDPGSDMSEEWLPYLMMMDATDGRILGLFRNWRMNDARRRNIAWLTEWPCIPWRGAYAIGLPQIISGLSAAATGALRGLLDSAHVNNSLTALKLKSKVGGQNLNPQIGQVSEIESSAGVDDIRKLAMAPPFNPPSEVLFRLLGFLSEEARGLIRTSMEDVAGDGANTPVGTTMARVEQGMVVFSSIHKRLHRSMRLCIQTLHDINEMYLDDEEVVEELGNLIVRRADFQGATDVMPVSDPNIFSEVQRMAQTQTIAARAAANPALYNQLKVEKRILEGARIPDADALLNQPPEPKEMNAVNENVAISLGRPVMAFPEQDHIAHLSTHLDYFTSPIFGDNPIMKPRITPGMLQHLMEHLTLFYASATHHAASTAAGVDVSGLLTTKDRTERRKVDQMLSMASNLVIDESPKTFEKIMPILQKAIQFMQSIQPPPPVDPGAAAMKQIEQRQISDQLANQVRMKQIEANSRRDQIKAQESALDKQHRAEQERLKLEAEDARAAEERASKERIAAADRVTDLSIRASEIEARQVTEAEAADAERLLEVYRQQQETRRTIIETGSRERINREDNDTAREISSQELKHDAKTSLSTGTGQNPGE